MLELNKQLTKQFEKMCRTGNLFRSNMTGQEVWDLYINSFEDDPIFRDPESSTHNCNLCNNFLRRYGNIVAIAEDHTLMTIFDVIGDEEFAPVVTALRRALGSRGIKNVFVETFEELKSLPYEKCSRDNEKFQLGIATNYKRYTQEEADKFGVVKADETRTFNHLNLQLPKAFVSFSAASAESIMGKHLDNFNVFHRTMEEIPVDTLKLVRDLILQGSLMNGDSYLDKLEKFIVYKTEYNALPPHAQINWCWLTSKDLATAKFKNELIGVLCTELAEGKEINAACQSWNRRVDPVNYMKAVAPFTENQKKKAMKAVEDGGFTESFNRRFAVIDDIKATEIKHMNISNEPVKGVNLFDGVKATKSQHKRNEFDGVEEVHIDKFMSEILPNCTSVEAYLMNNHGGKMVTMTTANIPDSKPMFKWDNNYSWTFNGNLAGESQIKSAVKSRGGETEGVLRVSMAFPNTTDDYDLHMQEPNGNQIYYSNLRMTHNSSGRLDLDAQGRDGSFPPDKRVENIIYTDKGAMPKGKYTVMVNNYSGRKLHTPCTFEIEMDGDVTIIELKVNKVTNMVPVCVIEFDGNSFTITPTEHVEVTDSKTITKEIYGLETNNFHKVNLVSLSPNHWNGQQHGNKHFFFMLEGCETPNPIRSFHAENLVAELYEERRVLEALGDVNMIQPGGKQLSGLGFNATLRDELIVRLGGNFKRVVKIKF